MNFISWKSDAKCKRIFFFTVIHLTLEKQGTCRYIQVFTYTVNYMCMYMYTCSSSRKYLMDPFHGMLLEIPNGRGLSKPKSL